MNDKQEEGVREAPYKKRATKEKTPREKVKKVPGWQDVAVRIGLSIPRKRHEREERPNPPWKHAYF